MPLDERKLLDMAGTYRGMAKTALAATLRDEFSERAERFERAASVVKRRPLSPPAKPTPPG
jgi:hypothetical protein